MFIELKNILVDDKTKVAGYSFIYHKMKFKGIKAINTSITEPGFIEFLNDNFGTKITAVKLPFRDPKAKRQAYNIILAKYVSSIKVNPSQD